MAYEFTSVNILPSNARRTAIVSWRTTPELEGSEFYIYKRYDGGSEWELLNEVPVFGITYADTNFVIQNKFEVPEYRVLAIMQDGTEVDSPAVAMYSYTGRKEYGIAQNIIRAKYYQAHNDGVPVLYYTAVRHGKINPNLDPVTGQRQRDYCPYPEKAEDGTITMHEDYGTYFEQGYYRPFLTYIRFLEPIIKRQDRLDVGLFDSSISNVEFLAYPPVRSGDLVVSVPTDKRWLVSSSVREDTLKGVIPISYTAVIELQNTAHPCYKVPIPKNYNQLIANDLQLNYPN